MNGDFTDIVSYPPGDYRGIIALQVGNHPEVIPQLLTVLQRFLLLHSHMQDYVGRLILVEPHRIRIRT